MTVEAIQDSISRQLFLFPQEKIHLHTDRNIYFPGEKIWFKAYIGESLTHQPIHFSKYIYVELINEADSAVERVMIKLSEDDMFHGNIFLSDKFPEGIYTLSAYTKYHENLGQDFFFKKKIIIANLHPEEKPKDQKTKNKKYDFDVTFYPEGGQLVYGNVCKVAFKALNNDGVSETITGEIELGDSISPVAVQTVHDGMGFFAIAPEYNKKYVLKCKSSTGLEKSFELPTPIETYSLATAQRNNNHYITVIKSQNAQEEKNYLLIHCRGLVLDYFALESKKDSIYFSSDSLPTGVITKQQLTTCQRKIAF